MDINNLIEGIKNLLDYMFGGNAPAWLLPTISWIIGIGLILAGLVSLLGLIKKLWTEFIQPAFYNPEDRRRLLRRQIFSDYVEAEIRRLNSLEAWSDNRFAELEAEVETEGNRLFLGLFENGGIRREKSLSKAIEHSKERLILLEGDPGAGKSVALRHVAKSLANKASRSRSVKSVIPLYINLKYLYRSYDKIIDRNLIQDFVLQFLNRINDRDVDEFLENEFRLGLENGTWLFLFDSFDEIPEILGSTEMDSAIQIYAEAIRDFLHGMNKCRGVIASREYKGPRFLGWPRFRILFLTLKRRIDLINKAKLPLKTQESIIAGIGGALPDFQVMTSNPMFLNLLCEYMHKMDVLNFPQHTHMVFEEYLWKRLTRDRDRLEQRFHIEPEILKIETEKLAFCMTADEKLGLNPTIDQLRLSINSLSLNLSKDINTIIDSLEYLKLARTDISMDGKKKTFTFSHRRFQEYFVTAIILLDPQRVHVDDLLLNARWRDTAVVLLQYKSRQENEFIIRRAIGLFEKWAGEYTLFSESNGSSWKYESEPGWLPDSILIAFRESKAETTERLQKVISKYIREPFEKDAGIEVSIIWPPKLLYVLGILQDGLRSRLDFLPSDFQIILNELLSFTMNGTIIDKKYTIEVAGITSPETQQAIMEVGSDTPSSWLKEFAYRQIARLNKLSGILENKIEILFVRWALEGKLFKNRREVYVHFAGIDNGQRLIDIAFLLSWMPLIDMLLVLISVLVSVYLFSFGQISLNVVRNIFMLNMAAMLLRWTYPKIQKRADRDVDNYLVSLSIYYVILFGFISSVLFLPLETNSSEYLLKALCWLFILLLNLWSSSAILSVHRVKTRLTMGWWLRNFVAPVGLIFSLIWDIVLLPFKFILYGIFILRRLGIYFHAVIRLGNVTLRYVKSHKLSKKDYLVLIPLILVVILFVFANLNIWIVAGIIFALLALFYVFIGIMNLIEWIRDIRRLNMKKVTTILEISEFVELISMFHTATIQARVIKNIRDGQLLRKSLENTTFLTRLISYGEATLSGDSDLIDHVKRIFISYLSQSGLRIDQVIIRWSPDVLDEFCRLYDYVTN